MSAAVAVCAVGAIQVVLALVAPHALKGYPGSDRQRRVLGLFFGSAIIVLGVVLGLTGAI